MNDPCLIEFENKWIAAEPKEKAQILSTLIMYVKRKYDVQNFRVNIDAKTKELEKIVPQLELKELLPVSRAIGYARKQIKELGNSYGTGLKRKPKGAELKDARTFKPIAIHYRADIEPEDGFNSGSGDEFQPGDLVDDYPEVD